MPTLTIIIPIYNAASTIARTVRSLAVLAPASRARTTVIAVDDGSSDDGGACFAREMTGIAGLGSVLLQQANGGSGSARNAALAQVRDGWVLFLDADDELAIDPWPLLDRCPECSALLFAATLQKDGKALSVLHPRRESGERLAELFTACNPYVISAVIFQRRLLENRFPEDLRYLEDWYFWAANPALFGRVEAFTDVSLSTIHVGAGSKTADQRKHGAFRRLAAERIGAYWQGRLTRKGRNNLAVQQAIGALQMGEKRQWATLWRWPVSLPLYAKLLVYFLAYRLYLNFYPYA